MHRHQGRLCEIFRNSASNLGDLSQPEAEKDHQNNNGMSISLYEYWRHIKCLANIQVWPGGFEDGRPRKAVPAGDAVGYKVRPRSEVDVSQSFLAVSMRSTEPHQLHRSIPAKVDLERESKSIPVQSKWCIRISKRLPNVVKAP